MAPQADTPPDKKPDTTPAAPAPSAAPTSSTPFFSRVRRSVVRWLIQDVDPKVFFGPGQPTAPVAQADSDGVEGRQYDFLATANMNTMPKANEGISFDQLRQLSQADVLLRGALETCKDRLSGLKWSIRKVGASKAEPQDSLALQIQRSFKRPDRLRPFSTWLRPIVEDMLVGDCATIYPRRSELQGVPFSFEYLDGSTIKPLIDAGGRTPLPPDPAYVQRIKGQNAYFYSAADLLYAQRNPLSWRSYGMSFVEQYVGYCLMGIQRDISKMEFYTSGSMPDAVLKAPPMWTPTQATRFGTAFNGMLSGNLADRHKVHVVPTAQGGDPIQLLKEPMLKDEFDDWRARVLCWMAGISVNQLLNQSNRSMGEQTTDQANIEGLAVHARWFCDTMNALIEMGWGTDAYECVIQEPQRDAKASMEAREIGIRSGQMTINQALEEMGKPPVGGGEIPIIVIGNTAYRVADLAALPAPQAPVDPATLLDGPGGGPEDPEGGEGGDKPPVKPKNGNGAVGQDKVDALNKAVAVLHSAGIHVEAATHGAVHPGDSGHHAGGPPNPKAPRGGRAAYS